MYGTHILLLINTRVLVFFSSPSSSSRGPRGVHSSNACNNIVQSSSREWDINTSICLYVQLFFLLLFFSFAFNKNPYTQWMNFVSSRKKKLSSSFFFSSSCCYCFFFGSPICSSRTLNASCPDEKTHFGLESELKGGRENCTVDEARTMRCRKPSQTFFTPQSMSRVYVPLKMYNVYKNTISNIIFIEWMNELKFFWFFSSFFASSLRSEFFVSSFSCRSFRVFCLSIHFFFSGRPRFLWLLGFFFSFFFRVHILNKNLILFGSFFFLLSRGEFVKNIIDFFIITEFDWLRKLFDAKMCGMESEKVILSIFFDPFALLNPNLHLLAFLISISNFTLLHIHYCHYSLPFRYMCPSIVHTNKHPHRHLNLIEHLKRLFLFPCLEKKKRCRTTTNLLEFYIPFYIITAAVCRTHFSSFLFGFSFFYRGDIMYTTTTWHQPAPNGT